jgi:two-component system, NarL family, sensor kinase
VHRPDTTPRRDDTARTAGSEVAGSEAIRRWEMLRAGSARESRPTIAAPPRTPWLVLADGRGARPPARRVSVSRAVLRFLGASTVVLLVLAVMGVVVSRRAAEREAIADAEQHTGFAAVAVVQPNLEDGLLTGDPAALARIDRVVRGRLLDRSIVRVKLWTPQGRIVYSDEPHLIGQRYALEQDELDALETGNVEAEVSDLSLPENSFERSEGKLLEVYRPIRTPGGQPLLFETYSRYDAATSRSNEILWSFGSITLGALILLELLQLPLVWSLLRQVRQGQEEREWLLARAVEASNDERRRIAADLHDGIVQDLAGASYVVTGSAERAAATSRADLASPLRGAADGLRQSIRGLRSLLVDLYPPSLSAAGLESALADLISPLRARGMQVSLHVAPGLNLPETAESLFYRVAQEAVRNVSRHAGAHRLRVTVAFEPTVALLEVEDDGVGLDLETLATRGRLGHVGLRGSADVVAEAGGRLVLSSARGAGTRLRLEVPHP